MVKIPILESALHKLHLESITALDKLSCSSQVHQRKETFALWIIEVATTEQQPAVGSFEVSSRLSRWKIRCQTENLHHTWSSMLFWLCGALVVEKSEQY
jgi:hypothetical protein